MIHEHNTITIIRINNSQHINNNNNNNNVLMCTYLDQMMALVYRLDKAFILIVKLFHLIINMHNHVGHDQAIRWENWIEFMRFYRIVDWYSFIIAITIQSTKYTIAR